MGTRLTNCAIATGHLEGGDFTPSGQRGDSALFAGIFPAGAFSSPPRVVVTPILEDPIDIGAFPVCVVRNVSTQEFGLAVRNCAPHHGFAAYNWLAVGETPGVVHDVPEVLFGVLAPLALAPSGAPGSGSGTGNLDVLDTRSATVLLTSADHGIAGHSVAGVGALKLNFVEGVGNLTSLAATNSDCSGGSCAFNWAKLPFNSTFTPGSVRPDGQLVPEPSIETGVESAVSFQPSCHTGDWHTWDIRFSNPFSAPPVVLLMANNVGVASTETNPAVVGVAQAVTEHGFHLAARNSDLAAGKAGFHWVAIGLPA